MGIELLGPLRVDGAGGSLQRRDQVVLSALAVRAGEVLLPDQLAEALWGDDLPRSWPRQIPSSVLRLRRQLGAAAIETTAGGYRLAVMAEELDTNRFEQLIARGRALAVDGEFDRAAVAFGRALALWRGTPFEVLDGWSPGRIEAARLEELRLGAEESLLDARLAAGEHRDVVAVAEARVAEQPLREHRWAILATALYRCGRQADALRGLKQTRRTLVDQLGIEPGAELVALEQAILNQDDSLTAVPAAPTISQNCPYKGLVPYDVDDADMFFGRDHEVTACLQRLTTSPLLVVTGPSGCGKSSLVRAGVIPALRRAGYTVVVFVPGADPQAAMTNAVASTEDTKPVVVVDQFEELFALDDDGEGRAAGLCARLAAYAATTAAVVVTIRGDHVAALAVEDDFARLAERGLHLVKPLSGDSLRGAIEGPATQAGLRLEPGLVDLLVRDCEGEPGALPLLSHALAETWRRRDGRVLTVEGYRATGEIRGAVARSADRLYESLPTEQRPKLRSMMLRLVAPTPDGEPMRSRIATRSLGGDTDRDRVLALLVRARLVTTEEDHVELAHEALARAWPRLRSWLDEDAAGQRILRHLSTAADGWESLGRPTSELYRGARLDGTLEWRMATSPDLTDQEAAFLDASVAAAATEREAIVERARQQARQNRRLRRALAAVAVLLVAALVGGVLAYQQRRTAQAQRATAEREERQAALTALTSSSAALRTNRRDLAALLAVEAHRIAPSSATESALFGTFTTSPDVMRTVNTDIELGTRTAPGAYLPGSDTLALIDWHGAIHLVDLDTGDVGYLEEISDEDGFGSQLDVATDGNSLLAVWHPHRCSNEWECYSLFAVWDLTTRERRFAPVRVPFVSMQVALNADGSRVAVSDSWGNGLVMVYDAVSGDLLYSLRPIPGPGGGRGSGGQVLFHPDGRLIVSSGAGPIRVVDPDSGDVLRLIDAPPFSTDFSVFVRSGGDTLIAVGSTSDPSLGFPYADMPVMAFDLESGAPLWPEPHELRARCNSVAYAERIDALICNTPGRGMVVFDATTGTEIPQRFEPQGDDCEVIISPDGTRFAMVSNCYAGTVAITEWRIDSGGAISRLVAEVPTPPYGRYVTLFGFAGNDTTVAVEFVSPGDEFPTTHLIDTTRNEISQLPDVFKPLPTDNPARVVALYDDVTAEQGVTIGLYDLERNAPVGTSVDPGFEVWALGKRGEGDWGFVAGADEDGHHLRGIDLNTGQLTAPAIDGGDDFVINEVAVAGNTLYASVFNYHADRAWVERRDLHTGELLGEPILGYTDVAAAGGIVVAITTDGRVHQVDPDTFEQIGRAFPPGLGIPSLSDDGSRMLTYREDGTLRLYDVASRTQLGDPIQMDNVFGESNAVLRPDGLALAGVTSQGFVTWDLDPEHWVEAACRLAGRNLTQAEWDQYIGDLAPYRSTCPQYDAA